MFIKALIDGTSVREKTSMTATCVPAGGITGVIHYHDVVGYGCGVESRDWLTCLSSEEYVYDILCYELHITVKCEIRIRFNNNY